MKPHLAIPTHVIVGPSNDLDRLAINDGLATKPLVIAPKIAKLIFFIAIMSSSARATTMIGFLTEKQALLGLDSKRTIHQQGKIVPYGNVCKIINTARSAYALAGASGTSKIDADDIIRSVVSDDIPKSLNAIELSLMPILKRAIALMGATDRSPYLERGEPIATIFAIGFDGRPVLYSKGFWVTKGLDVHSVPAVPESIPTTLYFERNNEISRMIPSRWFDLANLDALLRTMMRAGIKANHAQSGGPISIVRATAKGLQWIERGAPCQNRANMK